MATDPSNSGNNKVVLIVVHCYTVERGKIHCLIMFKTVMKLHWEYLKMYEASNQMVSTLTMCHHLQFIMLLLTFGDISQCTHWKMRINIYLAFIYCINNSKVHSRQVMIPFWGLCNKSFRITGGIHFSAHKYVEAFRQVLNKMGNNALPMKQYQNDFCILWITSEY